ncbi:McrB family protein [Acinetobacter baumannii]|uniref:McrB family protein n=1 Tax=Acinetobacter baumannii TaxID=470 RepID=UPI0019011CED|nr:AAA family ATPase [Acinetobacter baumannii]MBJ9483035.1 AAA family ATPase [Acinetobacter baumannii]MBJ9910658.1 AAA family ATPase [Acinetobacter baumannii]MBJ9945467.1 AAA family ATPase [Acinetobacter baumannii]MDV4328591.1 AAA family ATPase [Acinetobacter baumannii]MDV4331643.1 AAA family ATPase [Acinetobacter baumannii]
MSEQQIQTLWNEFLNQWSVEKVQKMTLPEYSQVGNIDTFGYWLEHKTKLIANILGGSAFKFGIYHRNASDEKENGKGKIYGADYAWLEKYGQTKEKAFDEVKKRILETIKASQLGEMEAIDQIDFSPVLKWKIAYLYQDQKNPNIVPIFSKTWLDFLSGNNNFTYSQAYKYLLGKKDKNIPIQEYGNKLAEQYLNANPKKSVMEEFSQHDSITSDDNETKCDKDSLIRPLNRILFGAAGTGKTYHTINHSLSILLNKTFEELDELYPDRAELKKIFDHYKEIGQIKFITFHQSFSYEDFVEGIRAEANDKGLSYDVKPGLFKELCDDARIEYEAKRSNSIQIEDESINQAIERLIRKAKEKKLVFHTKAGKEIRVFANQQGTLFALTQKDIDISLSLRHIRNYLKLQNEEIIDQKSYEWAIAKALRAELKASASAYAKPKPYVLIIDEINRGNISRIFGELITLIEDSKRQGNDEELSTILPYSKEEFSIPNNLYIIGTMNSSDRSLTGLDVALRRRFEFIEMPPRPELLKNDEGEDLEIDGLNIVKLLTVMNQRIEILLDRDHCIGHANFIPLIVEPKIEKLAKIFQQKIIPQLQEYFFDDWEKIDAVLNGNGMLHKKYDPSSQNRLFKDQSLINRSIWEIKPEAFNDVKNYIAIYNETSEVENELSGY